MEKCSIVTLTLNPAIDTSGEIERLVPGHKLRCSMGKRDPGGGGINVARVLRRLGMESLAVFPSGGTMGEFLTQLVCNEGLSHLVTKIAGETRENLTVHDRASGNQYRFVFAGPCISPPELEACCETALSHLAPSSWLIASGSLPAGAPDDTYAQLARRAAALGARFVLDTSGAALRCAMKERIYLLKASEQELAQASGENVTDRASCIVAAQALIAHGPETVAVSRGDQGALYVGSDFVLSAAAPTITLASTVGAGDSFLAALVWQLVQEASPNQALQWAIAAGSAALLSPGTELCHLSDIQRLLPIVHVQSLSSMALGNEAGAARM